MSRYCVALCAAVFLVMGVSFSSAAAEKAKESSRFKAPPRIELLSKATMEKLAAQRAVSTQVEILAPLIGTWDFDLEFWSKQGAAPQLSTGYAVNDMVFDSRYLSSKMNVILNIGGQNIPYKNLGYIGYDAAKKIFTSAWLDDLQMGITAGSGKYNAQKKVLEQKGVLILPTFEKALKYRAELEFARGETYKITFYLTPDAGQEYKAIEIDFRRRR